MGNRVSIEIYLKGKNVSSPDFSLVIIGHDLPYALEEISNAQKEDRIAKLVNSAGNSFYFNITDVDKIVLESISFDN